MNRNNKPLKLPDDREHLIKKACECEHDNGCISVGGESRSSKMYVPWTQEQIDALNKWQKCGYVHPYTCGGKIDGKDCREDLIATKDGWVCPKNCGYTQNWAMYTNSNILDSYSALKDFPEPPDEVPEIEPYL